MPWNVVVGVALMGVAAAYALDPDYPLAWADPMTSSAIRADRLAPRPAPVDEDLVFAWSWRGLAPVEKWIVVVLDAEFAPLFRSEVVDDKPYSAPSELRDLLHAGGRFHWCVEAANRSDLRSGIVAFDVR